MVNVDWPGLRRGLGFPIEEPEDGHFNIAAVNRDDIQEMLISKMGIEPDQAKELAGALTTEAMFNIAQKLSNEYFVNHFWTSLQTVISNMLSLEETVELESDNA